MASCSLTTRATPSDLLSAVTVTRPRFPFMSHAGHYPVVNHNQLALHQPRLPATEETQETCCINPGELPDVERSTKWPQ
eukprot:jgi/Chrzof1/7075/Cz02g09240.t1